MITALQIKAARALIGMDQPTLAAQADVSRPTIQRIENTKFGPERSSAKVVEAIQLALENEGVIFLAADASGGEGVRLARPKA